MCFCKISAEIRKKIVNYWSTKVSNSRVLRKPFYCGSWQKLEIPFCPILYKENSWDFLPKSISQLHIKNIAQGVRNSARKDVWYFRKNAFIALKPTFFVTILDKISQNRKLAPSATRWPIFFLQVNFISKIVPIAFSMHAS